jgi:hypothetical protein
LRQILSPGSAHRNRRRPGIDPELRMVESPVIVSTPLGIGENMIGLYDFLEKT